MSCGGGHMAASSFGFISPFQSSFEKLYSCGCAAFELMVLNCSRHFPNCSSPHSVSDANVSPICMDCLRGNFSDFECINSV